MNYVKFCRKEDFKLKESTKKVLKIVIISCSILIILGLSVFGIFKYIEYKKIQDNINSVYDIYNDSNRNEIITDFNNNVKFFEFDGTHSILITLDN